MKHLVLLLSLSLFIFNSCNKESNPIEPNANNTISGKISIGEQIEEISTDIGPTGGTVTVSNTESPINGLTITVPRESYDETRTYSISYAEITEHKLGEYFNPISPLITIKNGGGYSDEAFDVKIPISKVDDDFVVGILYDEITGKIEILPTISQDATSITVNTRHFATSTISSGTTLMKGMDGASLGNLVISSLKESVLSGQGVISSGFTPGIDDWEFPNFGSYISPSGHCAGQSITAMWYFYEKTLKGEQSLFHRFDDINNSVNPSVLWQDNPHGYRFASTIHKELDQSDIMTSLTIQSYIHSVTWKTFIAAMLLTGEPQFVGIMGDGGHAIIAYKINVTEGKMYIADPNYPNNRYIDGTETIRTITYSNGKFNPYKSYAKVGTQERVYDKIAFYGKTSFIEWPQIAKRYEELQTEKIGNDKFPEYELFMKSDNNEIGFYDGIVVDTDTLNIYATSDECDGEINGAVGQQHQALRVYDENTGNKITTDLNDGIYSLLLKPGANTIGLAIFGVKGYGSTRTLEYVDFKWFTVYYQKLSIEPNPLNGKPNEDCKFTALSGGTAPKGNSKYVWSFGDDSEDVTILNDSTVTHVYELEGSYTVSVKLFDNTTNNNIGEAFGVAAIVEKQIKEISINVHPNEVTTLYTVNHNGNTGNFTYDYLIVDGDVFNRNGEIIGNTISVSYDSTRDNAFTNTFISLTFDDITNPTNIVEFNMQKLLTYESGQTVSSSVSGKNIPFEVTDWGGYGLAYYYKYEGGISQYLTEFEWKAESSYKTEQAVSYSSQGKIDIIVEYAQ